MPVARRRANAARAVAKMAKGGREVAPVNLEGRKISRTFWGNAWCDNLESYSDFENRMPRGRTYVRNGSVVDLQICAGKVTAMVSGSELYRIEIKIKPLPEARWSHVQTECAGKIDSLIELLQGRLSAGVMQIVTDRNTGLFPAPSEISLDCSCPDWADMCKHVAASLYGVGARLDEKPELLFVLRGVDPAELISKATAAEAIDQTALPDGEGAIGETDLEEVFGIEIDSPSPVQVRQAKKKPRRAKAPVKVKKVPAKVTKAPVKVKKARVRARKKPPKRKRKTAKRNSS